MRGTRIVKGGKGGEKAGSTVQEMFFFPRFFFCFASFLLEVLGSPFADETVLVNEGSRVARREKDICASLGRIYSPIMINVLIWNVVRSFEIVS